MPAGQFPFEILKPGDLINARASRVQQQMDGTHRKNYTVKENIEKVTPEFFEH